MFVVFSSDFFWRVAGKSREIGWRCGGSGRRYRPEGSNMSFVLSSQFFVRAAGIACKFGRRCEGFGRRYLSEGWRCGGSGKRCRPDNVSTFSTTYFFIRSWKYAYLGDWGYETGGGRCWDGGGRFRRDNVSIIFSSECFIGYRWRRIFWPWVSGCNSGWLVLMQ